MYLSMSFVLICCIMIWITHNNPISTEPSPQSSPFRSLGCNTHLGVPFLGPVILPGTVQPGQSSSSSCSTLLSVLEMIRELKFTRRYYHLDTVFTIYTSIVYRYTHVCCALILMLFRKTLLAEMAKVLDRTKEIVNHNVVSGILGTDWWYFRYCAHERAMT